MNNKNRAIFIYLFFLPITFFILIGFLSVLRVKAQEEYEAIWVTFDEGGEYTIITGTWQTFVPEYSGYGVAGVTEMAGWWTDWAAVDISWSPSCSVTQVVFDFEYNNGNASSTIMGGWADFYNDSDEYVASTDLEESYTENVWHTDFSFEPVFFDGQEALKSIRLIIGNSSTPPSPPNEGWYHYLDNIRIYCNGAAPPTPIPTPIPFTNVCNLQNYSFSDGLDEWESGDWVTESNGWIQVHGNTDQLNSYIAQGIELTATGPSDYYEISISARSPVPVAPENAPFLRWKLNSLIPDDPDWYGGQALIFSSDYWQHQSWILQDSNSPAISDTLTIWASGNGDNDVQIDNVCITLHQGPAMATPICPPSPTYTPNPTYTPLPTPTPVTTATATAWAATATAWPTPIPYPTQAAPNCSAGEGNEPDWSFIWLAGQILGFLGAFFEAIFRLLGTVLQPIFDLIGFVVWLLGAAFGLIAQLIDLISAVLQFLISFFEVAFDILEIVGAFFVALWNVISASPADPGFVIPSDWGWPIAAWNFLIEGTPLELLEPVAMGIGSLLMILWTIRQFSGEG